MLYMVPISFLKYPITDLWFKKKKQELLTNSMNIFSADIYVDKKVFITRRLLFNIGEFVTVGTGMYEKDL